MGLIALVDFSREVLEAVPDFLAQFFGHGAYLAPVVVEFLKAAESHNHVGLLNEFLSLAYEKFLFGKVFLKIVVAELFVDLELVVEMFYGVLISFPEFGGNGGGNLTDTLEFGLEILEFGEETVYVVGVGAHFVEPGNNFALAFLVFSLPRFGFGSESRFLVADFGKTELEFLFGRVGLRHESSGVVAGLGKCLAFGALLAVAEHVELLF